DEQEVLLIFDEIQSGLGRTGRMFAWQHENARPDGMVLGKALSGGLYPVSAFVADDALMDVFHPGDHGSTFGGNPLACRAASVVLEILERDHLVDRAARLGKQLQAGFRQALARQPGVRDIRGLGLMIGIELDRPCAELVGQALEAGLLINVTAERVIRLLPPLILEAGQVELLVDQLARLIATFLATPAPKGAVG
ncbi:MAG: aminotransferase class III-fold pyridoxal phosphate-dependent enzyme, partial [Chromatiaceae bacterium]